MVVPRRLQPGLCLGLGLAMLGAVPSVAADEPATVTSVDSALHGPVAVLPPRAHELVASVDGGMHEWLRVQVAELGLGIVGRRASRSAAERARDAARAEERLPSGRDVPAIAAETGAGSVLFTELRWDAGSVELRLRLHDGSSGELLGGARAVGRLADLGSLLQTGLAELMAAAGQSSRSVSVRAAPRLESLGRYERALRWIEERELTRAWEEVKDLETATARELRREIERRAEDPETGVAERSRLASARGVQDRAWLQVRQAIAQGGRPEMLVAGADAAMARGEPDVAHRLYGQAIELDPDDPDAVVGHARSAREIGEVEVARQSYQKALALDPDDPDLHEAMGGLPVVPPEERAQHLVQAGDLRASGLDKESAEALYREASEADGDALGLARRNVAKMNERLGNSGEALLSYEEAAGLMSGDPETLEGLGRTRAAAGDTEGSMAAFQELIAVQGENQAALQGIGTLLHDEGRSEEAVPYLKKAVAKAPDNIRARKELADALRETGDVEAALASLDPGSAPLEERAGLMVEAAGIHEATGNLEEARVLLESAKTIEPHDPPVRNALAGVYKARGEDALAAAEAQAAQSLQGVRVEPTGGGGGERVPTPPVGDGSDFALVLASFPKDGPHSGKPLAPVHYLGLSETVAGWRGVAREWLLPVVPDLEALDMALLEAILGAYEVAPPPPVPAVAEAPLERLLGFSTEREDIVIVNDELEVAATFVARMERVAESGNPMDERLRVEIRLLGGARPDRVFILANTVELPGEGAFRTWNYKAALPWGLVLLIAMLPVIRGWGTIVVKLDFDTGPATKGFFSIQVSRSPGKVKRQKSKGVQSKARQYQTNVRSWTRGSRAMVGRETRFRWMPARTHYVAVHGLLQDTRSKEVIGNYLEERRVQLQRGETLEVGFDFRRSEAPLEVRVEVPEGRQVEDQVRVALRGRPDTMRYLREGSTVFQVGDGDHGVLVGEGDRVHEMDVQVANHHAALMTVLLGSENHAVFTGCPDAVDPYMMGDVPTASAALDRAGQVELANLLRARHHEARGERDKAARYYEAAGHMEKAAELAPREEEDGSASSFEAKGDLGAAARAHAENGDHQRAGEAYEAAYDYENAIDCYRRAGAREKAIELLERTGRHYEAGTLAFEAGDMERAARGLQLVDLRDPDYAEACRLLSQILADLGDFDTAVEKAAEAVQVHGEEAAPLELREHQGQLLERAGRLEEALVCFELILKSDPRYPEAETRASLLRDRIAQAGTRADADPQRSTTVEAGPGGSTSGAEEERYELLSELGRGGMGIVYKARDRRLGRTVALKRMPENLKDHPTAVRLFLREARAAAALNHPNIVTLYDADQAGGIYYLTMECLEGLPLDAILSKRGRLGVRDALRLSVQIATGLQYAHERGVVHRDVKTSNLFFTREKVVKIMDFGLAKMTEEVRRAATVIGGTPYYMAPEQATGEGVDHRADLYAFGVTLFELLTGRVPFTEGDVTYHHRHTPPPDPRELVPDLPEPVAAFVLRLMAKSPDERFETTAGLTAALEGLVRGLRPA